MDIRIDTFVIGNHYYINVYNEDERVGKLGIELISDCKVQIVHVVTNIRYVNNGIATMMLNHAIEKFGNCEISLRKIPKKAHCFSCGMNWEIIFFILHIIFNNLSIIAIFIVTM